VYSALGKLLFQDEIRDNTINFSNINKGVYLVIIKGRNDVFAKRVILN
jgi:hypothetical protein